MKIEVEETYVDLNEVQAIGKIFHRTTSPFSDLNYHLAFHLYLKSGIKIKIENPNEIRYDSDDQRVLKIKKSIIDLRENIINLWSKFEDIEKINFEYTKDELVYNNEGSIVNKNASQNTQIWYEPADKLSKGESDQEDIKDNSSDTKFW